MPHIKTVLHTFLNRHLLWGGLLAVLVPLLVILWLQYRSLTALEAALPAQRKEVMNDFLHTVISAVEEDYQREAQRALALSPQSIRNRVNGHVVVQGEINDKTALPPVAETAQHFRSQPFSGAKSLFFVLKYAHEGRSFCSAFFYDPASGTIKRDMNSPLWVAIQQVASPYCTKVSLGTSEPPAVVGARVSPGYYFLLKPLADKDGKLIGVVGAELDSQYLREILLPQTIRNAIAKHFPHQQEDIVVTLEEARSHLLLSHQADTPTAPEVQMNSKLVFQDWAFGVRMRGLSNAQTARRVFVLNISMSVLMALLLSGGVGLALRTAAREMKLSQMKSDFVSNVSHELRTPLSSIRVFGELLKQGRVTSPEIVQEFGAHVEAESRRLTGLINKILDFSHIESGRKQYRFAPLDVGTLVAETVKAYDVLLQQEGFDLQLAIAPTPALYADAEALTQAVVNLLDNAVKYSALSRVLQVRVAPQGEEVIVAVTDQGIGIAAEEHGKIFEKFYRVNTGYVHDVKGSGLGLAIVWHIAAAHCGKVTVTSTPGQGSTFTLHLPVNAASPQPAPAVWQPDVQWEGQ